MFIDVRDFTPYAEANTAEDTVARLNALFEIVVPAVVEAGGHVNKFLGDGALAVFGAPMAHPDHSARAIRTALAMQEGIGGLNERRAREGKEPITVGIGVSAGEAVAGTVGTEDRMEYTVIGDSVNLAARLESNAKPGQILISHPTYERVRDLVESRPLGRIRVKGKEEEVEVHEVLGLAP